MRASWGLNRSWLLRVRSADNASVAARVAGITFDAKGAEMHVPAASPPLFVELPIFVLGGLVSLEPRDLVSEQTCRTCGAPPLTCAAGKSTATAKLNGSLPV